MRFLQVHAGVCSSPLTDNDRLKADAQVTQGGDVQMSFDLRWQVLGRFQEQDRRRRACDAVQPLHRRHRILGLDPEERRPEPHSLLHCSSELRCLGAVFRQLHALLAQLLELEELLQPRVLVSRQRRQPAVLPLHGAPKA